MVTLFAPVQVWLVLLEHFPAANMIGVFLSSVSLRIWLGVEFGTVSSDTSVKIGFLFLSAGDFIGLANVIDTTA
jgi:hypothetical protein